MLLSVASMIGMAAPVYADPDTPSDNTNKDGDFLKQVTNAGLTYKDGSQAVAVAKNVCDMAGKGTSEADIEKKLVDLNSFSGSGARQFMVLAANSYCPSQLTPDDGQSSKTPGPGDSPKPPGA
ncbi:MAG TPA: DUF732 domain-containing protein [Mycobacterium sp.]|uniref:DUF732 domain-containing protein n=1 Tax=Mycobacterium sp. TaxID=1785 RepID=UPI002B9EB1FC|nr:DUF732 domain-containing protein [Mycobacterium sp.]HXO83453.1 DUF732 domain-containing protein [Mycobacterium sp.]